MPARNEHSEPPEFSERKPDRDQVMQVYIESFFPKHKVSGVFFDATERLNEDRKRRATCIDDPDADASPPPPPCDHCEYVKVSLHERLRNKLPSPSVFTPLTYRSKYHSLQAVEMASMTRDLPLKDDSLKARGMHYDENRKVIEAALEQDRILREEPHVVHALKCQFGHSLKTSGSTSCGFQDQSTISDLDTLQYLLLGQQELRRDIARLECVECAVCTSIETLDILPVRYRGNVLQRKTLQDEVEKLRRERLTVDEEVYDAPVDRSCSHDYEEYRAMASLDPMIIATANLAVGESFPFVEQARRRHRHPATRRSSSVYSNGAVRTTSGTTTPHIVLEGPDFTDSGNVPDVPQSGDHDRAAAHKIMQSIRTYHNSGRISRTSSVDVSADNESIRTGRRQERRTRGNAVVTSPTRHDEERYPRRQNIVQQ
jgi:hypothetical protein